MRHRSPTNSKPHENKSLRAAYLEAHPYCLLCKREPSTAVHHIRRGCRRVDINANFAALCHFCHMVDGHDKDNAVLMIRCLFAKLGIGELDVPALDAIGTPYLAGWLYQHEASATGVLLSMWFRLVKECGE